MRRSSTAVTALALMIVVIGSRDLSAHRRDELLQAARIGVTADRIDLEMSLTPGIAVADEVIGTIDRDRNGMLSADERRDYAALVTAATELRVDGDVVNLGDATTAYPRLDELRGGDRSIELRWTVAIPRLSSGRHEIAFTNRHRGDIGVYLANALKPDSDRIVIASQHRDPEQRALTIGFTIDGSRFAAVPVSLFGSGAAVWLTLRRRLLLPRHES